MQIGGGNTILAAFIAESELGIPVKERERPFHRDIIIFKGATPGGRRPPSIDIILKDTLTHQKVHFHPLFRAEFPRKVLSL